MEDFLKIGDGQLGQIFTHGKPLALAKRMKRTSRLKAAYGCSGSTHDMLLSSSVPMKTLEIDEAPTSDLPDAGDVRQRVGMSVDRRRVQH